MAPKKTKKTGSPEPIEMSSNAHLLAAIGTKTESVVKELLRTEQDFPLFKFQQDAIKELTNAFSAGWIDDEAVKIIKAVVNALKKGEMTFDIYSLARWVRAHDNADAVMDCMMVNPPSEISIIEVLSRAGSQKLVFLANWRLEQRQVVLKKLIGPPDMVARTVLRELQPHPLSMRHPNIIETHKLANLAGEPFLVEKRLFWVMEDDWHSQGIQEGANLLRDISSALKFLSEKGLVHGDVKPNNIGRDEGRYILLDFGICRPAESFSEDTTATGSLRTRAPELLLGGQHTYKSDVWALGATVFNCFANRFPLYDEDQTPPRTQDPTDREDFERMLANRAENKWDQYLEFSKIPDPILDLIKDTLEKNPKDRIDVSTLLRKTSESLAGVLRFTSHQTRLSPVDEAKQIVQYLRNVDVEDLKLMPDSRKEKLAERLRFLVSVKELEDTPREGIESILKELESSAPA